MLRRMLVTGRQRAFTLLELLVVMAIVAMAAAAVPLALDRLLPARRVAVAADRLRAAVREAQTSSLLSGRPITLDLAQISLPRSVHVSLQGAGPPTGTLIVFPDGSAQNARLAVAEGEHLSVVRVSALTGHVSVERVR